MGALGVNMKQLLAGLLLLPGVVLAQQNIPLKTTNKPVSCGDARAIYAELQRVGENPIWYGNVEDPKSVMSLWISKDNNTWTMLQSANNIACVIDVGSGNVFSADLVQGK
ncbi:hypothetical protein EBU71_14510 [bacterium]|nr:hypothetical protein [Candidatus Elulimicrobium humile]